MTTTPLLYIIYIPPPPYCTLLMYNRVARRERHALRGDRLPLHGLLILLAPLEESMGGREKHLNQIKIESCSEVLVSDI